MTNDGNHKAEAPESPDSKNLDSMAKAFLVSMAWSYAKALEQTKRSENQQQPAPESESESKIEQVDRNSETNQ
ncbi:MAG: hypothetical protein QQW96_13745 [Tychonema bourrellyi B0820]|uniref:Uncharacterized protein n=1 Tax=Tychonema bourrellyi FEM_GT703 TaxID=2040638 RepID=A0A2G4F661_9CYAN|nr:hypothetical protein [Tychonema bourrellyi]MDQ2098698.1 hypothetical protein [Tychonema bourrellyi B0820]PHX57238.1 hypothetical protein CP500_000940 [Tychonema bourrellyi FEM_GT703]